MNNKELLIDFIEYVKSRHIMPILHSNIEPLVDDYLHQQNLQQCNVSGALPQEIEDACVKFGIYVYAHNCNVDEAEVNVELVKEDYKRYLDGRQ